MRGDDALEGDVVRDGSRIHGAGRYAREEREDACSAWPFWNRCDERAALDRRLPTGHLAADRARSRDAPSAVCGDELAGVVVPDAPCRRLARDRDLSAGRVRWHDRVRPTMRRTIADVGIPRWLLDIQARAKQNAEIARTDPDRRRRT